MHPEAYGQAKDADRDAAWSWRRAATDHHAAHRRRHRLGGAHLWGRRHRRWNQAPEATAAVRRQLRRPPGPGAERGEQPSRASRSPAAPPSRRRPRQPSAAARRRAARAPACTLRGEVEGEAKAEEAVGGTDDAQVGGARLQHPRVRAEQAEPGCGQSGRDADRLGDDEGEARPATRSQRPGPLAGADVRADDRDHRRADAEDERDQQVFQTCAGAETGDGVWTPPRRRRGPWSARPSEWSAGCSPSRRRRRAGCR